MPKHRRTPRVLRRAEPTRSTRQKRDKENNLNSLTETGHDPLLTFMKIEVKEEELDPTQQLDLSDEMNMPLKIEQFETLDYDSIKHEESPEPENGPGSNNQDLNILIEWALNLQFDHSKHCSGRLYPCKEIFDNFSCKIVVLYCTVCKKRMLHTLKDWAVL